MNFRTFESSDTEFGEQENDALLLDIGVGDTVYLSANNFLCEDGDNYINYMAQKIATEPNCYTEQFKN
jgi:hypothetical protein